MSRRVATVLIVVLAVAAGCAGAPSDPIETPTTATAPATRATEPVRPSGTPEASTAALSGEVPSRVAIEALGIDLPVVSGDATVPGNPADYPLCGVAQYLTTYRHPGRPGTTTWLYAHARPGMFLPLLDASREDDGSALIGLPVDVYSTGLRRFRYRVAEVLRHATDRSAATEVPADSRRLVLQTSEGPRGTVPKLQVVADFTDSTSVSTEEAVPSASPVGCFASP